ncbi:recombinase family protein [Paenibacillus lautus]|uniref:recombinase family protein n=1 Tax=Paenibacillus lautus TaxID=1401 RepID=UPI003D278DB7
MAIINSETLLSLGIEQIINYLRKSRADEEYEKKTGEDVLKAQKELMDRVLEPLGIPYDQRLEVGSGDKISTRPVFQTVIKDLEAKKYQLIAVKEISRMGRGSYKDMGLIYDLIVDNRIFILTPYKLYDPRNPADLRQIRFELFMSREEFETTRERLFGGRVSNAFEGRWVAGAAPFGYTYNKTTKRLEVNEEQAKVIRAIFDFYVNGIIDDDGSRRDVSFRSLGTYLERKTAFTTPKGKRNWSPTYLRTLLTTDRFMGTLKFKTTKRVDGKRIDLPEDEHIVAEDAVPAIIDRETWDRAQKKIRDSRHKPHNKMDFSPCELAGICRCSVCGKKMVRQYSVQKYTNKSGAISTYHKEFLWCTNPGCTFVKYRAVEESLLKILERLLNLKDKELKREAEAILANSKRTDSVEIDHSEYISQRLKELKNRMNFIYEKYESGRYSDEVFDERKSEVEKELMQLKELESQSSRPNHKNVDIDLNTIRLNIKNILEAYKNAEDKTDRNSILRKVFEDVEVVLVERGRGRIPAKFNLDISIYESLLR